MPYCATATPFMLVGTTQMSLPGLGELLVPEQVRSFTSEQLTKISPVMDPRRHSPGFPAMQNLLLSGVPLLIAELGPLILRSGVSAQAPKGSSFFSFKGT